MRVEYGGKVYEFDPDEQRKTSILDLTASDMPGLSLAQRVWLGQLSVKIKGIKVTEVTDDRSKEDLGRN